MYASLPSSTYLAYLVLEILAYLVLEALATK